MERADAAPPAPDDRLMLAIVGVVLAAVAAGALLERRLGAGRALAVRRRVVATMLWVLVPFVAYVNIARVHLTGDAVGGMAIGALSLALTGVLMWRVARGPLRLDRPATGAAIVSVIQSNTGFFVLPIVAVLFTQREFAQAVAYDILVSLPSFVVGSFTVGALFGTGRGDRHPVRHVVATLARNPVLYAAVAAALVPESWAPEELVPVARAAVYAMLPLSFLVIGITLADEAEIGALRVPPPLSREVAAVIALRMVVMPALVIGIAAALIDLPPAFALMAAAPTGANTIIVAHRTGLSLRLTADAIAWTTAIALVALLAVALARAL